MFVIGLRFHDSRLRPASSKTASLWSFSELSLYVFLAMHSLLIILFSAFCLTSFLPAEVEVSKHDFFDASRGREVPALVYQSEASQCSSRPLVIINHGYGGSYKAYSYIANALANQGYSVVSVQQDLAADPPLPREGDILALRKPFYERGIETLLFLTEALELMYPGMCYGELILIGHSNGGDIVMAFSDRYPRRVRAVISLDSFRYPFPVCKGFPILSLRASDSQLSDSSYPAEGVESVIIEAMLHNEMDDTGSGKGKKDVLDAIMSLLAGL